ncbi:carbon-nitrogen hydrolase family protein [Rhodococcus sp. MS13]|uniref:carbon-nitrogen hydrolase family protein n=1 Tax=Rhodococcus sp. MS13 TaxID=2579940 RepID=UPI00156285F9|nr:carbon-nitrogen hydrolase family protein [Rhodococcus sp. MS13]NRH33247.1 carbon-nitrogen hydrolase family protein [Rhodococcus sp. MS13]
MTRLLPIALEQIHAQSLSEFTHRLERQVKNNDAALHVYPEYHLRPEGRSEMGDEPLEEYLSSMAEPIDGKRGKVLAELAGDLGIWLLPGTVVEQGPTGSFFNTAVVYSPEGKLAASYRKVFPFRPTETCVPGSEFVTFEMKGFGRIGLSVCYDAWFPEVSRHLAWMGAELVLNVVQTGTNDRTQEVVIAQANAIVNQNFVASVNAAAPTGMGRSLLVDPEGRTRIQAISSEEITLTDVIDLDQVGNVRKHGTAGVTRPWDQFNESDVPIKLPFYGGEITPTRWQETTRAKDSKNQTTGNYSRGTI